MEEHLGFVAIAAFVLAYGLISKRLERSAVTAPMVFAACGVLLGPAVLGWIELNPESSLLDTLAEGTLVLVLFADAASIDLRALRKSFWLPVRLLGVGLPLSMLLGAVTAHFFFPGFGIWEAALIAAILAPTDAALGQAVVSSESVPARIRQALNVESGLNDGICLPFVMMFLALAAGEMARPAAYWAQYALGQLVLGPIAGVAVGYLGGKAIERAVDAGWMNEVFQRLSSLALALLAFCVAELLEGNGFIAAFVAGLTLGSIASRRVCHGMLTFAETEGQLLGLLAFLAFGAASVVPALDAAGPAVFVYGALSLTAIRMLPVSLSLAGMKMSLPTHLFLGWFGPRGLASILYVLLAAREAGLPHREEILGVVMVTVLLSVFAHGLSAVPGADWYSKHAVGRKRDAPDAGEHRPVAEMVYRRAFRGGA